MATFSPTKVKIAMFLVPFQLVESELDKKLYVKLTPISSLTICKTSDIFKQAVMYVGMKVTNHFRDKDLSKTLCKS
jgi:hypothetical protein